MLNTGYISLWVLDDNGNRTVAQVERIDDNGVLITGSGSAGRERGDKWDSAIGEDLAVARALRVMADRLERRARGRVNHAESVKAHRAEIAARKAEAERVAPAALPWPGEITVPSAESAVVFKKFFKNAREAGDSLEF